MYLKYQCWFFFVGMSLYLLSHPISAEEVQASPEVVQKPAAKIEETVLGMNVSGNKEAPNLLYIIPWKEIATDANPPEIYRLMDEVYSTVDPDVFEKEVDFYGQLTDKSGKEAGEIKENQ